MLFNSIEFSIFLPLVFVLYWFVANGNYKKQNILLLFASYFFYGWWDWRFLTLIFISSLVDYAVGIGLSKAEDLRQRKLFLLTSIIVNLGFLGFFKYFNFFAESFATAFTLFGWHLQPTQLNIILPVGISFYTFQSLSYSIDVYKHKCEPTKEFTAFFTFVSFFPQLVAGPIERAKNLLPQLVRKRVFDYNSAVDGMRQILWGLFKKVVVADNAANYVDNIFNNYTDYAGSTLLLGAIFFAFQIYCDFSGYFDIAIGSSRLFGINLMTNFAFPYFSRDIAEFWRRWHISLATWFRDYVYIPLGGSKGSITKKIRNIIIIFLISAFWHGANWTFIAWGAINALYILPLILLNRNRVNTNIVAENSFFPNLWEFVQIGSTFFLTVLAWVYFRSPDIQEANSYINGIFSKTFFSIPEVHPKFMFLLIFILTSIEWIQRRERHAMQIAKFNFPIYIRWGLYYFLVFAVIVFGGAQQEFIYFQF